MSESETMQAPAATVARDVGIAFCLLAIRVCWRIALLLQVEMAVEFQAVILAGGAGNRMYPLTEGIPKPLLPIATRPLLSYQLELLEKAGFNEALVVTQPGMEAVLRKYVNEGYNGKIRVRLCALPTEHKDGGAAYGTADALRFVKDKIKTDFFVISGDLISDVHLHYLADLHRTRHSSLTVLLKDTSAPPAALASGGGADSKHGGKSGDSKSGAKGATPAAAASGSGGSGGSSKKNAMDDLDRQFIGLDEKTNRLVLFKSASDVEDGFAVTKALLKRYVIDPRHLAFGIWHLLIRLSCIHDVVL